MKTPSPLFAYAHDGKLFYKAVMKRLAKIHVSLNHLCHESGIDFTTAWRWNSAGSKPDSATVSAIEDALRKLEK